MSESVPRRLVFVVGTRAQLIKVAPVIVECERLDLTTVLLMTGQHQETMQDLVEEFGIKSPQLSALPAAEHATVRSLLRWLPAAYRGIRFQLKSLGAKPSCVDVLVHGDTLSTLVGALVGRRFGARIVHLESGLTSGRLFDPFPEELFRRLVFRLTNVAMCPSPEASAYMSKYHSARVIDTGGNTIIDAVAMTGAVAVAGLGPGDYLVASLHRFKNIYNISRLRRLIDMLEDISKHYRVRFVLHPATRRRLESAGLLKRMSAAPNIELKPRMGYGEFLRMAAGAACVLTDGGSNQEELAALGVPTIIMRERTERGDGLGENAVMETDVREGVVAFVTSGAFKQLKRPISVNKESPSRNIARALTTGSYEPSARGR